MYKKVDCESEFRRAEKNRSRSSGMTMHIFKKSMEHRKEGETYTFYDGPPTANGKPHIGHVVTRVDQRYDSEIPHHERINAFRVRPAGIHMDFR